MNHLLLSFTIVGAFTVACALITGLTHLRFTALNKVHRPCPHRIIVLARSATEDLRSELVVPCGDCQAEVA